MVVRRRRRPAPLERDHEVGIERRAAVLAQPRRQPSRAVRQRPHQLTRWSRDRPGSVGRQDHPGRDQEGRSRGADTAAIHPGESSQRGRVPRRGPHDAAVEEAAVGATAAPESARSNASSTARAASISACDGVKTALIVICLALGTGTAAKNTERLRAKLKRLVARGVFTERESGLFALVAQPATSSPDPMPES